MESKKCSRCKEIIPIDKFYRNKGKKDSASSWCKGCTNEYLRTHYVNKYKERKEYFKEYQKINSKKIKEHQEEYRKNNLKKIVMHNKEYRQNNSEKFKEIYKKSRKKRILNLTFHLNKTISHSIYRSLKKNKNGYHWETLVNYNLQDLMTHLEKHFKPGMTLKNHSKYGWHIDHIIPVSWWKFNTPQDREFKQCWSLCNLQPLWKEENESKGNRIKKLEVS